ncbi:MAG: response regulator [Selenomonadaceae bacterium]|nr:response regulator [Selenomonadaceae bacterium]
MSSRNLLLGKGSHFLIAFFFAMALLLVGVLFQDRMSELLTYYTENQTKRQAETLASQAAEKLGTELENLGYIASKIEANPEEIERLMPLVFHEAGVKQGLLAIDGHAIFGDSLSLRAFDGIQDSFRGKSAVTFVRDQGILFTCPVFHGKNIKYVLYRLYPMETIKERFSISCYDDIGRMCVVTRDGDIVIPFAQVDGEDISFLQSGEFRELFQSMHQEMEISVAAAHTFHTKRGELILFGAEIPDMDYLVAGFVPKEKAAEGIGNLTLLVVWVFGLLLLLIALGAVYLVQVRGKIDESEALERAKAAAEEASRAKSEFLANMSHEIRTPINSVLGLNEVILRECGDKNILSYAEGVKTAGNTLLGLINDILDFSKIEAGKMEIAPVEYDISLLLTDLVNMIRPKADEKRLAFTVDVDRKIPKFLYGDEVRVKQAIMNILTNAVKYTEEGGVTFSVGFEHCEENPGSVILLVAVRDTGIGIKPEDISKLFSKFDRIEEKRNRHVEGTGLGMAITQNLLDMMGTTLQVESTYGLGSKFYFRLKQDVVKWEPLGDYEASSRVLLEECETYREKFTAPDARILMVDDNAMNLLVFKSLLKQTQVKIDTANDGYEGLSLARKKKYDIIFLDHMMPGKDGIETLREMREEVNGLNSNTPAICLTANAISGAREQYIAAGFDEYLTKPIDSGKLEEVLMEYLPKKVIEADSEDREDKADSVDSEEKVSKDDSKDGSAEVPEILAPLKKLDWLDVRTGMLNSGDLETYLSLLKIFSGTIDAKAKEIEDFYAVGNWKDYVIKVHAMKSSARLVGAKDFGEEAQKLENAGKSEDMDYIHAHHAALMDTYRSFRAPLAEFCASLESES